MYINDAVLNTLEGVKNLPSYAKDCHDHELYLN